jgi:rare lipoprotein A
LPQRIIAIFTLIVSSFLILASTYAEAASWTGGASYYRAPKAMGCAHRFLPFGTRLKVTNLRNGRELILTVNDRGPFIKGRIVDVSTQAATILGFRQAGVVPVRIETMSRETVMN